MKFEIHGKVTGISYANSEMTDFLSTVTFPDPRKTSYISYINIVISGKLTLGEDVKMTITNELEEAK